MWADFEHSVDFWGEGDRICYARFMRDKVRARFGVDPGGWVVQDLYASSLSRHSVNTKTLFLNQSSREYTYTSIKPNNEEADV